MKPTRKDFQVILYDTEHFRVAMRKPFLIIFYWWTELTHIEDEKEAPVEFKSFNEATDFISSIVD